MDNTSPRQVRAFAGENKDSAYPPAEAVEEVGATMAFEGMELTEEDIQMLYAYWNKEVSGDALRKKILSEVCGNDGR